MLKVVIIGYGDMFTNLIAGTLDANCEIVGVLRRDTIKYPKFIRKLRDTFNPSREYNYIKSYSLNDLNTKSVNSEDFKKQLLKLNPDIILVGSWGEKIKKDIFSLPKIATINAHPSLLPKYRGPNPYFWVIKNMEQTSGVTFHLVDEGFDTGAILAQEEIKVFPSDTGKSLKERTVLTARGVVCELLSALREDIIIPLKQREENATYYSNPDGLELDFQQTADENSALIRAIHNWCHAWFYHKNYCFRVLSGEVVSNNSIYNEIGTIVESDYKNKTIGILCSDNKILRLNVRLYRNIDKIFTSNVIKYEMPVGSIVDAY